MLKRLREISSHQQKLLDDTFSQLQPKSMFENRQPSFSIASQQEGLRRDLKTLMKKMNEIIRSVPPALKKADRAMKGAKKSLARGKRLEAVKRQTEALGELNEATERLAERLARRMNGKTGFSLRRQSQQWQGNRDPFGRRPMGDGAYKQFGDGSVKIPTEREIRRSREILDELRLRSSDRGRPDIELKYIERLMNQF